MKKHITKYKFVTVIFMLVVLFFDSGALAQITNNLGNAPGSAATTVTNLLNILRGLSCWFIRFGIIAVGVMTIVYGLMFLLSRGNSTAMLDAKKALTWGIVGGLVIMGVFTIILTIPALLSTLSGQAVDYPIASILNNCL